MDYPSQTDETVPEMAVVVEPKPWGFWATIGLSLVVVLLFVVIQTVVVIGYVVAWTVLQTQPDPQQLAKGAAQVAESAGTSGLCLAVATWSCMPPCVGLVLLFARFRGGWTVREYLALKPVPLSALLGWLAILAAWVAAFDGLTWLLGRPIVPEFMHEAYRTAYWTPLLWAALVVASPLCEESLFRGFMMPGILHSRAGVVGAILIPTVIWTLMHVQYDAYALSQVFAGGLLLAVARLRTRSLYPSLAMHALMNLIATSEAMFEQWL